MPQINGKPVSEREADRVLEEAFKNASPIGKYSNTEGKHKIKNKALDTTVEKVRNS